MVEIGIDTSSEVSEGVDTAETLEREEDTVEEKREESGIPRGHPLLDEHPFPERDGQSSRSGSTHPDGDLDGSTPEGESV